MGKQGVATPRVWDKFGFSLFKESSNGESELREVVDHLTKLLPCLSELKNIDKRVSDYINAGVVEGLRFFVEDMLIHICCNDESDAGKIFVNVFDDYEDGTGEWVFDLQDEVNELAFGNLTDPEVMEAWAVWFENAAKTIRSGINTDKSL